MSEQNNEQNNEQSSEQNSEQKKNDVSALTTAVKIGGGLFATVAALVGAKVTYDNRGAIQDSIHSNLGVPVLIVGASAVGKTTLINYLHPGSTDVDPNTYIRTQPPGRIISDFKSPTGQRNVKLELKKDVPGESFALWRSLLKSNKPQGIAFLVSHQDDMVSKDEHIIAWNKLLEILREEDNISIAQNLKAFHVFVNKIDQWCFEGISKPQIDEARKDIKNDFAKQIVSTKSLAERYGFHYNTEPHLMSLLEDNNVQGSFNKFIEQVLKQKRYV